MMTFRDRPLTLPRKPRRRVSPHVMERARHLQRRRRAVQVAVIINPASGQGRPVLKLLNRAFKSAGVEWEALITHGPRDGHLLAQVAVRAGVKAVAVYGGDGTVNEVASGLVGSGVPLGILPGGTTNGISLAFGIPRDLEAAIRLLVDPEAVHQTVDIARIGERYFLQLAGIGMEAKMVEGASRELKDRFGMLAYGIAALQALSDPPVAAYRLELDDRTVLVEGVSCLVANGTNLGFSSLGTNDGLLEVYVLRKADLNSILTLAARLAGVGENQDVLPHYRASRVTITAEPAQIVQMDGEVLGSTPVSVSLVPRALQIIVPGLAPAEPGG